MNQRNINDLENTQPTSDPELLISATRSLLEFIDRYCPKTLAYDALRALTTLTIERIESGKCEDGLRFETLNVVTAAGIVIPPGKAPGTVLSRPWCELEKQWPERLRGVQEVAADAGLRHYVCPIKEKSDGGHSSKYHLEMVPIPDDVLYQKKKAAQGEITYIRDLEPKPSWWARFILNKGYRVAGWRRRLLMTYFLGTLLLAAGTLGFLWLVMLFSPKLTLNELGLSILVTLVIAGAAWETLSPFIRLFEWRIIMAPTGMIALNELDVQLEMVRDPKLGRHDPATIRLVRYSSVCPHCGGMVSVVKGGKDFPNRLVGRCQENPSEHVYSFDRLSCVGRMLRG